MPVFPAQEWRADGHSRPGNGMIGPPAFVGRDPDGLVALPAFRQHVLGKPRQQIRRERRLLQREGMIAAGNDDERTVREYGRAGFRAARVGSGNRTRRSGSSSAADRRQLRRQRFEVEKGLHQVLQGVDVVDQPALPLHGFEIVQQRLQPADRTGSWAAADPGGSSCRQGSGRCARHCRSACSCGESSAKQLIGTSPASRSPCSIA